MSTEIASAEAYDAWVRANPRGICHFWASWCEPCAAMDVLLDTLRQRHPDVATARCDAEAVEVHLQRRVPRRHARLWVQTFTLLNQGTGFATTMGSS